MDFYIVVSFLFFTGLVALISYLKTKKTTTDTLNGLFFANRNNNFWVVGGALFLSNLSANQFIGENESIFTNNMSVISWGVSSVLAMLLISEFVLPIYFRTGVMTIPDFLGKRYDTSTKRLVSLIFLLSYLVNLLPSVLYGGAIAFNGMLDIFEPFDFNYWLRIWIMVWFIGIIGAAYSLLGGLRAITISDTVLSVGFLIVGLAFPYFGFKYLGEGDWVGGLDKVLSFKQDHLTAVGNQDDEIPFGTIFTGMFIMNLYYWGMEQYIVQQAMTAKNLAHSQKGMALAGFGKILSPFLINIPGIIGVHIYGELENTAEVFRLVVKDTLPAVFTGLTAAVVLGAAITTFNSGLKSSSTLFILNFYKPRLEKKGVEIVEKSIIRTSKRFEIGISLISMIGAPFIIFASTGFYTYLQQLAGLFSIPIFTIVLLGFVTKKVTPQAAKIGLFVFVSIYITGNYVLEINLHYLHFLALLFLFTTFFMLVWSRFSPHYTYNAIEITGEKIIPWKNRIWVSLVLVGCAILIFILFSPVGIA